MATSARPSLGRLHFLDSLRGFAALYVIAFHLLALPRPAPTIPIWEIRRLGEFGGTGVFLFFLISGFSLSFTMNRHDRTPSPTLSYALSRFFRIVPLFYVLIAVHVARAAFLNFHRPPYDPMPTARDIFINLAMLFNLVPYKQEGIVWASWTIGVEMLFYVMFLPIYRWGTKIRIALFWLAAIGFEIFTLVCNAIYPQYEHLLYLFFGGYVSFFVLGMLTYDAFVFLEAKQSSRTWGHALGWGGLAALIVIALFQGSGTNIALRPAIGLAYAALLVGCALCRPKALENRVMRYYGALSYSVYLLHPLVVWYSAPVFALLIANTWPTLAYGGSLLWCYGVVTALATLTYFGVEKPGIRLGARLFEAIMVRRSGPPAPATAPAPTAAPAPVVDRNW